MWTCEHPEFLFLLLLLVPAVWARHFWRKRGGTITFAFSNWRSSQFQVPVTWQTVFARLLDLLFWGGFICLIIALAAPAEVRRERVALSRGIDLMLVLDCSPSMAAQDFGNTSRFDYARTTIRDFIKRRENDPIGLIAFGADAALRVAPTLDYDAVLQGLTDLRVMDLGDGTAIGLGLVLAGVHCQSSSAARKVVILLTDGENNSGEILPDAAAGILSGLGCRVYAIGIGSSGEVPLEYVDPETGKLYRGTYKGTFGEALLKSLASKTGGHYFTATSPGALESVFQSIDSIERVEKRVRIEVSRQSLVSLFVWLGLIGILTEAILRRLVLRELI